MSSPPDLYHPDSLDQLQSSPPLYGVIGYPVHHSLSPGMQLAGFQALNVDAQYIKLEIKPEELSTTVERMKSLPFAGWNCTLPHKIELSKLVDQQSESAKQLGGVNTVLNTNGKLTGFNTDGQGWVRAIREEFSLDVRDLRVMILGMGGAGQALAKQAALEKCERLVLVNRTFSKAQELIELLQDDFYSEKLLGANDRLKAIPMEEKEIAQELDTIDLVVNCTSMGLKPDDDSPLPARILQPHLCLYDTIYRPSPTKLMQAAREAGARCANGLSMLLHQGALSLEIWTGKSAPLTEMKNKLQQDASK